jgi:signal transduction histidine kinase
MKTLLEIQLFTAVDASASHHRARQIAHICGFSKQDQTRLATTVSELARSATHDTRPGRVAFHLATDDRQLVIDVLKQTGGGIASAPEADAAFDAGILAAQRFGATSVTEERDATRVRLQRRYPAPLQGPLEVIDAVTQLDSLNKNVAMSQTQQINRDLAARNVNVTSLNSDLRKQAESLVSADQRKDEFLAILAHELRGPLSAVGMAAGALGVGVGDDDRDKAHRLGQLITRQVAHMSRIVEDLLDVSRIVRNEIAIERGRVDLTEIVHATVEQLAAAIRQRNHVVTVRVPDGAVLASGDRTRLIQVLSNLVGNSIRYTPEGGRIKIELTPAGADGQVTLSVQDNGIGMPAELLPHLFDLFTQAQRSTDSRNSGLGLGLALVKTLVEAHGGAITATSPGAGQGSRFTIMLPRERGAQ